MSPTSKSSKKRPTQPSLTVPIANSLGVDDFQDSQRPQQDGSVDELSADGNGGVSPGFRLAEPRRDFARVFNFVGLRRKYRVDHVDLTWIEGRLRREAETPRLAEIGVQSLLIVEVRKNTVDTEHVRCGGRVHDL